MTGGGKKGVTFVTPWYGKDIPGGAEAEARRTAQNLAAAGLPVQVLTTCLAGLGEDWDRPRYQPGESREDGVLVRRFPAAPRDPAVFAALNGRLMAGAGLSPDEEHAFFANMVHSPALLDHIAAHPEEGPFFFIPYLFTTSVWGPLVHPDKSVIIPCLHDEGYARMAAVRRAFEAARAVVFHVPAERDLAAGLYDLGKTEPLILGEGVDSEWSADAERFRKKYGLPGPFVLYAGRKDAGKNVPLLVQYFLRYLRDHDGAGGLKLVMIGNLPAPIPPGAEDSVIDLGFVPLQDKYDAYAAAYLLAQPSLMESFSLVIMESWLAGRPVMVHGGCAVTREHALRSGGGLPFSDYPHFAEGLELLLGRPEQAAAMGAAGRRYVLDNYSWPVVTGRFAELIERLHAEPVPPAKKGGAAAAAPRRRRGPGPAVHQMVPDLAYGDAIGNEVLAMQKALRAWGFESDIFAAHLDPRLAGRAEPAEAYARQARPDDVVLFHFSIGHPLADLVPGLPGRKVLRYHNITPARFLEGVSSQAAQRARMGREQLPRLASGVDLGLGVSAYNCAELTEAGCPRVAEVPILKDWASLRAAPDPLVLGRFTGTRANLLHVGRIAPNKRIEDLIKTQHFLSRLLPGVRLLLVGGGAYRTAYGRGLRELVRELGTPGVYFSGHIPDSALTAYYQVADLYLCMSEHEGFCVPLVEAMHFGLPIVARAEAGVPGTLADGGVLLPDGDPLLAAETCAAILGDQGMRPGLAAAARDRLERFAPQRVDAELRAALAEHLGLEAPA